MYKYILIVFIILFSIDIVAQQQKIPEGYTLITLDGKDAYMNFETGDVIRTTASNSNLLVDQKLKTTSNSNTENASRDLYLVLRGDTLFSIAKDFNMSVSELKALNNLRSNNIFRGQKLKISSNNSIENTTSDSYLVLKGDTLYSIAKDFNMSVSELKELNDLHSNKIFRGQKLRVE